MEEQGSKFFRSLGSLKTGKKCSEKLWGSCFHVPLKIAKICVEILTLQLCASRISSSSQVAAFGHVLMLSFSSLFLPRIIDYVEKHSRLYQACEFFFWLEYKVCDGCMKGMS